MVHLAGWEVTKSGLTKGNLGAEDSIILSTVGITTTDASANTLYFGEKENKTWSVGIGKHFGVTKEGGLYCTGGKIAGWNINSGSLINTEGLTFNALPGVGEHYIELPKGPVRFNVIFEDEGVWGFDGWYNELKGRTPLSRGAYDLIINNKLKPFGWLDS